jgi:hypothetical protein
MAVEVKSGQKKDDNTGQMINLGMSLFSKMGSGDSKSGATGAGGEQAQAESASSQPNYSGSSPGSAMDRRLSELNRKKSLGSY